MFIQNLASSNKAGTQRPIVMGQNWWDLIASTNLLLPARPLRVNLINTSVQLGHCN